MKHLICIAMAACLAVLATTATAQEPGPDAKAAEADLRALIPELQAGRIDETRVTEQLATAMRPTLPRFVPILGSFGAPGPMQLQSQGPRSYTFVVTHPLGDIEWQVVYETGGGRVANIAWGDPIVPAALQPQLELWHGLAVLPGKIWKEWMLDLPGKYNAIETCWWVQLAVQMECETVLSSGGGNRATFTLQGDTVVRTAPGTIPGSYTWHEDGSSTSVHQNARFLDVRFTDRTYYTPQMQITDSQGDREPRRWVSILDQQPGQADPVFARLSAEHEAAKAAKKEADMARLVEELGTFDPDPNVPQAPSGQGLAILNAFIGGLSEGMADNAQLAAILNQGNSGYSDPYVGGYDTVASAGSSTDSPGGSASGTQAPAPAAKPLRFVLMVGMHNLPGDKHNPTCFSNVITRPGPPGWGAPGFLPSGSSEQAMQQIEALKGAFIAACERGSGRTVTSANSVTHVSNRSADDEARVQSAGPRFAEDVSVSLN